MAVSERLKQWLIAQAQDALAKAEKEETRAVEAREHAAENMKCWMHEYPDGTEAYHFELRVASGCDQRAAALRLHAKMLMEF